MIAKLFTIRGICFLFVLIVGSALLMTAAINKRHDAYHISKVDTEYIENNLSIRWAENCIVEPIEGG